jgi:hypothetical protein
MNAGNSVQNWLDGRADYSTMEYVEKHVRISFKQREIFAASLIFPGYCVIACVFRGKPT